MTNNDQNFTLNDENYLIVNDSKQTEFEKIILDNNVNDNHTDSVHDNNKSQSDNSILNENESCYVPKGYVHRLTNETDDLLVIVEVQCGDYTGEDDIERYEDDHGRV